MLADASKAREKLGWKPRMGFSGLVRLLVDTDIKRLGRKNDGCDIG
ncbi:MAG: hypothetical protein NTX79_03965 [Candidatus Micrarchaeota archaeon]|nr:hypothetical protein [Candidatus Micrarchaeota archaeon]